jgi:hypothetical protein
MVLYGCCTSGITCLLVLVTSCHIWVLTRDLKLQFVGFAYNVYIMLMYYMSQI